MSADAGSASLSGNTITWTVPSILDQTVTLAYHVDHAPGAPGGEQPIHQSVDYTDAEGNPLTIPDVVVSVLGCDADSDGVVDEEDACPGTSAGATTSEAGCSVEQLCPCDGFDNHGKYVSCVANAAAAVVKAQRSAPKDKGAIVSGAAKSACSR